MNYAVILAAGLSSRMGAFKPLLPVCGEPAIVHLANTMLKAGTDACVIVTGYNSELLTEAFNDISGIVFIHNPAFSETDMFESVRIGLSQVPSECRRVLLTPADIPLVRESTIRMLLDADAPLVHPCFNGMTGHPLSFSGTLIPQLMSYSGNEGLRGAVKELDTTPVLLDTSDPFVLMDMDTPEDYEKLTALSHGEH